MIKSMQPLSDFDDLVEELDEEHNQIKRGDVGIMPTRAFIAASRARNRSRQIKGPAARRAYGGSHKRRNKKLRW